MKKKQFINQNWDGSAKTFTKKGPGMMPNDLYLYTHFHRIRELLFTLIISKLNTVPKVIIDKLLLIIVPYIWGIIYGRSTYS